MTNIRIFEYIRIFSDTNIRSYHIRIIFLIQIYSDIRSYCFLDALASLDFTLVSQSVSESVGRSFEFEAFKPVYIRQKAYVES